MKWDASTQRPFFFDGYMMPNVMNEKSFNDFVDDLVDEYYRDSDVDTILQISDSIKNSFKAVGFNVERYMLNHTWKVIDNIQIRFRLIDEFILRSFRDLEILDYISYYNSVAFLDRDGKERGLLMDIRDLSQDDIDILCRLYFCETETDVWDMYVDGIGSIHDMCGFYTDSDDRLQFLLYLYHHEAKHIDDVIDELVSLLGMDDDSFFDEGNADSIRRAWDLGVVEIREKFVHTNEGLERLKELLA